MKISIRDGEILVDFTGSHFKNIEGNKEIIVTKKNFLIPIFKGIPKTSCYYNRNKVNPHYLNCSCKEYKSKIKLYPLRDIRRLCKHIFFILTKDYIQNLDELTKLLLEHQFWEKISDVYEVEYQKEKIYLSFNQELNFIHVYRKISQWKSYTYYPQNESWKENLPPFKNSEDNFFIASFLQRYFLSSEIILA